MWPTTTATTPTRPTTLGYGLNPEMGMFVVAPATSFHHESLIPDHHLNVGVGVIPLLSAAPCGGAMDGGDELINRSSHNNNNRTAGGIQFWQSHHQKSQTIDFETVAAGGSGGIGGGATTCQDCGNQAKKDCSHRRCRTCCRSRGFDCSTHVRSTWVPAARRRERQMMGVAAVGDGGCGGGGGGASSGSTSGAKKPRLISSATTSHTSTSNTPPRSFDTTSSRQDVSFKESLPGQVRAPAVFKCVRVTAVDDGEDEFAYQAIVNIGGHVFKGFLYDQGLETRDHGFPNLSDLHLGGGASGGSGGGRNNGASSSSPLLNPSDVYGPSCPGAFLGGSSYGNTIN